MTIRYANGDTLTLHGQGRQSFHVNTRPRPHSHEQRHGRDPFPDPPPQQLPLFQAAQLAQLDMEAREQAYLEHLKTAGGRQDAFRQWAKEGYF